MFDIYDNSVSFVTTYWLALVVLCFIGGAAGAYLLGRVHGSPVITALIPSETRKAVTEELAVIDIEVSNTVNEQAARIMQLERSVREWKASYHRVSGELGTAERKLEQKEALRKKWYKKFKAATK